MCGDVIGIVIGAHSKIRAEVGRGSRSPGCILSLRVHGLGFSTFPQICRGP